MRLKKESHYLLELLAAVGMEVVEGVFTLPLLYKATGCSSDIGFFRRVKSLENSGLIEHPRSRQDGRWIFQLTEAGRSVVTDEIQPESCWNDPWNGKWQILAFDLPRESSRERKALRKWLRRLRFGRLQGSLWITPRDIGSWQEQLEKIHVDSTSVVLFEGRFLASGERNDHVRRAWDFSLINRNYQSYMDFISHNSPQKRSIKLFADWFQEEILLWNAAFRLDPFLPKAVWPPEFKADYLGPKALGMRRAAYRDWRMHL